MSDRKEHLPSPEPPLALVFHGTGDDLRALFDRLLKDEAVTVENNQYGFGSIELSISTYGCESGFCTVDMHDEIRSEPADPAVVMEVWRDHA